MKIKPNYLYRVLERPRETEKGQKEGPQYYPAA